MEKAGTCEGAKSWGCLGAGIGQSKYCGREFAVAWDNGKGASHGRKELKEKPGAEFLMSANTSLLQADLMLCVAGHWVAR